MYVCMYKIFGFVGVYIYLEREGGRRRSSVLWCVLVLPLFLEYDQLKYPTVTLSQDSVLNFEL